jgi:hypothetical protein
VIDVLDSLCDDLPNVTVPAHEPLLLGSPFHMSRVADTDGLSNQLYHPSRRIRDGARCRHATVQGREATRVPDDGTRVRCASTASHRDRTSTRGEGSAGCVAALFRCGGGTAGSLLFVCSRCFAHLVRPGDGSSCAGDGCVPVHR